MLKRVLVLLASLVAATAYSQQPPATFKSAVVALTEDAALRQSFETELVAIAKSHAYDAVTSYDITSDVESLDTDAFIRHLDAVRDNAAEMVYRHHIFSVASVLPIGAQSSQQQFQQL